MSQKNDWNPANYLKFKNERNLPSIDLVKRIDASMVCADILDIGCGPGNSSSLLLERWPGCRLTGIDNSPKMIERASNDYPGQEWIVSGAHEFEPRKKFDLAFSNAAFQWIPDHPSLIKKYSGLINEKGALAVQLPQFYDMPVGRSLEKLSSSLKWPSLAGGCEGLFTTLEPGTYYDILSLYFRRIEIWNTDYIHIFDTHMSIFEMIQSTALRRYLGRLKSETEKTEFEAAVIEVIKKDYPARKDGRVLFPFMRFFFIGYK